MTKTAKQILLEAADLIEQPGKWTQGAAERDEDGNDIEKRQDAEGFDLDADVEVGPPVCWCALGAMWAVMEHDIANVALRMKAIDHLRNFIGIPVDEFNDAPGRTASEVAAKMREAAETLP